MHFSQVGRINHETPHTIVALLHYLNKFIVLESASALEVGVDRISLILDTVNLSIGAESDIVLIETN